MFMLRALGTRLQWEQGRVRRRCALRTLRVRCKGGITFCTHCSQSVTVMDTFTLDLGWRNLPAMSPFTATPPRLDGHPSERGKAAPGEATSSAKVRCCHQLKSDLLGLAAITTRSI
jgi:hypothetical protein